jgi:hypothetical protein
MFHAFSHLVTKRLVQPGIQALGCEDGIGELVDDGQIVTVLTNRSTISADMCEGIRRSVRRCVSRTTTSEVDG